MGVEGAPGAFSVHAYSPAENRSPFTCHPQAWILTPDSPNTEKEIATRCRQGHREVNGFLLTFLQVNRTCKKLLLQWKVLHHMGCQGRHRLC